MISRNSRRVLAGLTAAAAAAAVISVGGVNAVGADSASSAATNDWLHVRGNQIVTEDGNPVWMTGANWFGFNTTERVFHGLWSANIEELTRSMAQRGINIVRVPIASELLLEWKNGQAKPTSAVNEHANPELAGMTTLEIWDYWLGLCDKYGVKVMIDVHHPHIDNSGHIYPMWFRDAITPEVFYQTWEWITARHKTDDTVVAMDIQNEPHGKPSEDPRAKWDSSTDVDNWKHACETAGRRILAINPNVLILCEGIEIYPRDGANWSSATNTDYYFNWWGGNLRGVRDHPVNLGARQSQLVYSPHDYGPSVWRQPWFEGEWNKSTLERDVWQPNWFYIHQENTAPLLIGEWGGHMDGGENEKWMTALRDFMVEHRLHQTFWAINPNSGDTGGLLLHDWSTWDEQKYALLKPALWQHNGKFVSLSHSTPLGGAGSTTGVSLADVYGGGGDPPPSPTTSPSPPPLLRPRRHRRATPPAGSTT